MIGALARISEIPRFRNNAHSARVPVHAARVGHIALWPEYVVRQFIDVRRSVEQPLGDHMHDVFGAAP